MPESHALRRGLALLGALALAFALSAAGCSTSGRELPAPTTTPGAAFVAPTTTAPATTTR